ncbi:ATP-binding protein [Patescibacteria group bacterium]
MLATRTSDKNPAAQNLSQLDFHHGEALLRVASHYPTLLEVIFESVQNALDSHASNIYITINQKSRKIIVADDGRGTAKTRFEKALVNVCHSIKSDDDLGQFGMGLISPLGKCESFTFTSTPSNNNGAYIEWTFDTAGLQKQAKIKGIPNVLRQDLRFDRSGKSQKRSATQGVPWRTQVKISKYTKDRIISRVTIDSLREGVLSRFSEAMRRHGTTIIVNLHDKDGTKKQEKIVPDEFTGTRLSQVTIAEESGTKAVFKLYIAKKTAKGRKGKVKFGELHNDYRLSFAQFAKTASEYLDHTVLESLNSGVFEGEILSTGAKTAPDRKQFLNNDNFFAFCLAIEEWFETEGEQQYQEIREEAKDQKYQRLGLRSIKVLQAMLDQPRFSYLKDVIKSFKLGTIGQGHTSPDQKPIGKQEHGSVSTQGDGGKKTGKGSTPDRPPAEKEYPNHTPLTVGGSNGRQRVIVRNNSLGLQFHYDDTIGITQLWELDTNEGILKFNTLHPLWEDCEQDEKALGKLQEYIAITALTLETVPAEWKDKARRTQDEQMESIVFWLLEADKITGRKRGPRKKK